MLKHNVFLFAGQCLDKHDYLTSNMLQRHILNRPEVGKNLPIEELDETLNLMVEVGWLKILEANQTYTVYRRNFSSHGLTDDNVLRRVREEYRDQAQKVYR